MARKLLLCIDVNGATAARWGGGRLDECDFFGNDEEGMASFREYAAASAGIPAFIMVDAIEEDYRFETLPHATGSERAQMVERKLRQYYRGSQFSSAALVGRDSSKRRDDRFLFSALTNPEIVSPWLAAVNEAGLPVGGIYLLPTVTSGLVNLVEGSPKNLLFVAAHPAGIRLTFFREGAFRLSRLSRTDAMGGTSDKALIEEISNTRLYLHALRAATLDEPVNVVLLDHADQFSETARAISEDNPSLQCSRLGKNEIAARLKLDAALIGDGPAVIYLHLLGSRAQAGNLASAAVTEGYRRYQWRRQLMAASVMVAAIGLAGSGFNLWQQDSIESQIQEIARRTAQVNADYQAATRQFPAAPTSADNLKKATEVVAKLKAAAVTPERFLKVVSRAIEPFPEIALSEIGWQYRTTEFETASTPSSQAPAPAPAAAPGPAGALRLQSGMVAGQIRDFKGDFRQAIAAINTLADRLRKDPAVENVRIVQLPLNVSPTLAMTGNTAENPAQSGSAEFRLVVVLKRPT